MFLILWACVMLDADLYRLLSAWDIHNRWQVCHAPGSKFMVASAGLCATQSDEQGALGGRAIAS